MSESNYENGQNNQEEQKHPNVDVDITQATLRNIANSDLYNGTDGVDHASTTLDRNDMDGLRLSRRVSDTSSTVSDYSELFLDINQLFDINQQRFLGQDFEEGYNSDNAAAFPAKQQSPEQTLQGFQESNTNNRKKKDTTTTQRAPIEQRVVTQKKKIKQSTNTELRLAYDIFMKNDRKTHTFTEEDIKRLEDLFTDDRTKGETLEIKNKQAGKNMQTEAKNKIDHLPHYTPYNPQQQIDEDQQLYDKFLKGGNITEDERAKIINIINDRYQQEENNYNQQIYRNHLQLVRAVNIQPIVEQNVSIKTDKQLLDQFTTTSINKQKGTSSYINTPEENARLLKLISMKENQTILKTRGVTIDQITNKRNNLKRTETLEQKELKKVTRQSKTTTIKSEALPVGQQDRVQKPTTPTTTTQLPVGTRMPNIKQGTPNYDSIKEQTQSIQRNDTNQSTNDTKTYPTREKVDVDEINHNNALTKFQLDEAKKQLRDEINRSGAHLDFVDKYGGIERYINDMIPRLQEGISIDDILGESIEKYYYNQSQLMRQNNMYEDQEEMVDRDNFRNLIDPYNNMTDEKFEELYNTAQTIIDTNQSSRDNRTGDEQDMPDQGGQPISSSTGGNTNGIYPNDGNALNDFNVNGTRHDPYNPFGGGGGGGRGGGGGGNGGNNMFNAMTRLHQISPHIANMLSDPSTRSLLIKRDTSIKNIYPEISPNNLNIVQQAIARYNYDSNLLNVYFS
jgi:hypothetical protein